mmetsp:Transcript_18470/g.52765  ORF Transcript_18470/g.52765 Transcript_18470/m.52765 type:complete len:279 (+) Transcript_18470:286-1122(+)
MHPARLLVLHVPEALVLQGALLAVDAVQVLLVVVVRLAAGPGLGPLPGMRLGVAEVRQLVVERLRHAPGQPVLIDLAGLLLVRVEDGAVFHLLDEHLVLRALRVLVPHPQQLTRQRRDDLVRQTLDLSRNLGVHVRHGRVLLEVLQEVVERLVEPVADGVGHDGRPVDTRAIVAVLGELATEDLDALAVRLVHHLHVQRVLADELDQRQQLRPLQMRSQTALLGYRLERLADVRRHVDLEHGHNRLRLLFGLRLSLTVGGLLDLLHRRLRHRRRRLGR